MAAVGVMLMGWPGASPGQAEVSIDYTYDPNGQLVRAVDSEGNVLTYDYDFGGNLTGVPRSQTADFGPPTVASGPATINSDETVDLRIEGSNLLLAEIASSNPDLTVLRYRANDTHVLLSLELPPETMVDSAQLTFTTNLGAVTYDLNVLGPRPVIFSVFPNRGGSTGGTRVRLVGKNLTADTVVRFGAQVVPSTLENPTSLVVDTPPGEAGKTIDISATNVNGTTVLSGGFTYSFPFAVPGAIGVTSTLTPGSLEIRLLAPAVQPTTLSIVSAAPSIVAIQESVTFNPGEDTKRVLIQGIVNGVTRIDTSLGSALLSTAVFVTDPYQGPIDLYAASVGHTVLEGAESNAVGVICLPRRLPIVVLTAGQSRTFQYPLPSPAGAGGLTLSLALANPQVATVPPEINVAEGAATVQFSLDAGVKGITRLAIVGAGVNILIEVYVDTTPQNDGPFLARPVGVYPIPVGESLAKPVGAQVDPP